MRPFAFAPSLREEGVIRSKLIGLVVLGHALTWGGVFPCPVQFLLRSYLEAPGFSGLGGTVMERMRLGPLDLLSCSCLRRVGGTGYLGSCVL